MGNAVMRIIYLRLWISATLFVLVLAIDAVRAHS